MYRPLIIRGKEYHVPPKPVVERDPYTVALSALLEINRAELGVFIFPLPHNGAYKVHFDYDLDFYGWDYSIEVSVRWNLKALDLYPKLERVMRKVPPRLEIEDVALIERAMSIGLKSCNREYECDFCERTFSLFNVEHKGKTHSS